MNVKLAGVRKRESPKEWQDFLKLEWVSVPLFSDQEHRFTLTEDQKQTADKFWNHISLSFEQYRLIITFRGENKNNLRDKLIRFNEPFSEGKVFAKVFLVGDKAKLYYPPHIINEQRGKQLLSIQDISDKVFAFIFQQLHYIFTNPNFSKREIKVVENFKTENAGFVEYFVNEKKHLGKFIRGLPRLTHERERLRDYYLCLLHGFGKKGVGKNSFFVSTSTRLAQAKIFAGSQNPKVIIYFVPYPLNRYGVSRYSVRLWSSKIFTGRWPIYKNSFYPEQEEISIKGALFPHFIFGIYDLSSNLLIINPHIFNQTERQLKEAPLRGLQIDQLYFKRYITDSTNYRGYVGLIDNWFTDLIFRKH